MCKMSWEHLWCKSKEVLGKKQGSAHIDYRLNQGAKGKNPRGQSCEKCEQQNKLVLDYNSVYKINIHEVTPVWINEGIKQWGRKDNKSQSDLCRYFTLKERKQNTHFIKCVSCTQDFPPKLHTERVEKEYFSMKKLNCPWMVQAMKRSLRSILPTSFHWQDSGPSDPRERQPRSRTLQGTHNERMKLEVWKCLKQQ